MVTTADIRITLPEDLAAVARAFAERRHCSLDGLAEQALRSYIGIDQEADAAIQAHRRRALELGLTPEEYAVHVVKEYRAEKRRESAP